MDQKTITLLLLVALIALVVGGLLMYFINKSATVKRNRFDELKDEFAKTKNELDTKLAIESELRNAIDQLQKNLSLEKEKNQSQEYNIAELKATSKSLQERMFEEKETNKKQQQSIEQSSQQILQLKSELSKIETLRTSLEEKISKQSDEFEAAREKSLIEFENIANRLFEEKTTSFSKASKQQLEEVLKPLKENLTAFKKKVEETYDKESKQRFSLEDRIKELVTLNQQISKEASNLTNALKGSAKTQGNWGEMILESILEHSGLVKNREYFVQDSFIDEQGNRKQPDIKIKYPDNRYILIDSKVSLLAYDRYTNEEDPERQKIHLADHLRSIKAHIDNLSGKDYDRFDKTLDFVMLFVPIEPAYLTALQQDHELWNYAYKKRILLISPTNLIAALKMVADIWKREQQNSNAAAIAKRGEMLYEKFVGFVADLEDVDKHLTKVSEKYNDAMKKLSSGSGNLIGQAEKLKRLGVHTKKELPEKYLQNNEELDNE